MYSYNADSNLDPISLFYDEESDLVSGHYQSIRPICSDNLILKHYLWTRTQKKTSSLSSFCPTLSSTTIECPTEKSLKENEKKGSKCHICGKVFTKNHSKKKCRCRLFCHKSYYGKCNK